jgi:alkylhydroperoxidase/carboxymuconolactone decarboxylase family protein YurZ
MQQHTTRHAIISAASHRRLIDTRKIACWGNVWKRPGLSQRDRAIATLAALIARNQTAEMGFYLDLTLENGVKPREIRK